MKLISLLAFLSYTTALYIPHTISALATGPGDSSSSTLSNTSFVTSVRPNHRLPGWSHRVLDASEKTQNLKEAEVKATREAFNGTCQQVRLAGNEKVGNTILEANCRDDEGVWWETSLNLNECFGLQGGGLVYKNGGNFDTNCRPCVFDREQEDEDLELKCHCSDIDGKAEYTTISMDSRINPLAPKPVAGRLVCGDRSGSKTPNFISE